MRSTKYLSTAAIMLAVAIITIVIGRQILKLFNLSIMDIDFTYDENNPTKNWINFMTPLAKKVGAEMGIPYQAMVVQTALETSWGKSSLFSKYNNFGGIKAVGNQPFVIMATTEVYNGVPQTVNAKFRTFDSKYDGLVQYAKFFHDNARYNTALGYPNDPYQFIAEIKKAGYATDPNYVAKLQGMLNKYFV